eukprot:TRINITY_DN15290_c0_g1_i1.p1 TRINITY_DN15290_c0_g1~~TRINITY_DN15290_c0_g1_i1.p1  ORF type:complete len:289 (-),score=44.58 TRINITY_DN15290_c0_g1_i1:739-1605(-)
MGCRGFLQCLLKLSSFILAMVGVSLVVYSLWMLNEWNHHSHPPAPPPTVGIYGVPVEKTLSLEAVPLLRKEGVVESVANDPRLELPAPWFIYATLGVGIFTTLVTCVGLLAAETHVACCLSCYTFGLGLLILTQGIVSVGIFLDDSWEKDIPADPTGELEKTKHFVLQNLNICKWVGLGVLIVEVVGLLLALTLRAMQDGSRSGYESDDDYAVTIPPPRRQPLLTQAQSSSSLPERPTMRNDAWSTRLREKYGVDTNEFTYNPQVGNHRYVQAPQTFAAEQDRKCTIL